MAGRLNLRQSTTTFLDSSPPFLKYIGFSARPVDKKSSGTAEADFPIVALNTLNR